MYTAQFVSYGSDNKHVVACNKDLQCVMGLKETLLFPPTMLVLMEKMFECHCPLLPHPPRPPPQKKIDQLG